MPKSPEQFGSGFDDKDKTIPELQPERENKPDFIIDARTPEMIADIERKKPELERRLSEIGRRALRLFESTGDIQSSIEQAVRETRERE